MYLVTGATGNIGSQLVRTLLAAGEPVRAVIRDRDQAASLPAGAEPVVGDLNDANTLIEALNGVTGLFLLPGYDGAGDLLRAAARAGVQRLVQLSGGSAGSRDMTNAVTAYMSKAEDLATDSGLRWTILRPSAFMTNALRWLPQLSTGDEIAVQFANVRAATIDPADIAAVAATALTKPGHEQRIYRVTGPESLTPGEQVAILAEALDRPLRARPQTNEQTRAEMIAQMPAAYVDAFFDFYVTGSLDESAVLPTVEEVTGRPPGSFRAWAYAHTAAFQPARQ